MRKAVGCLLLLVCGVAQAARRHENWDAVKKLAPGMQVIVQPSSAQPEFCSFVSADDAALTCDRIPDPDANWTPASKARLVVPRSAVLDVWQWQADHRPTAGQWVLIGLVTAWEIGMSAAGGVAGFLVANLVLLPVVLAAETDPWRVSMPPRPPRMRRRLIYQAPAAATP